MCVYVCDVWRSVQPHQENHLLLWVVMFTNKHLLFKSIFIMLSLRSGQAAGVNYTDFFCLLITDYFCLYVNLELYKKCTA